VGHALKTLLSLRTREPLQATEKPVAGLAPTSHWNCVVGAVRMQPRPDWSVSAAEVVSRRADSW